MTPRILIAGGGTAGLETARRLERSGADLAVTLVEPRTTSVYQPLLPEVASGVIDPRHATVPFGRGLDRTQVLRAELCGLDHDRRLARIVRDEGDDENLAYDHLVVALGSITRMLPIPGLAERAIGCQTIAEALYLRDRLLERVHLAASSRDGGERARALTVVVVGGGYSGVEVIGELESMVNDACRVLPDLDAGEAHFVLVEATSDILPMVSPRLRRSAVAEFERRGIDVRLDTQVQSIEGTSVHLSDGTTVDADTLVWCAGVRPHPVLGQLDLPLTERGSLEVDATLQVPELDGVWAAGDGATVPDLVSGGSCPPSAQYALRQARRLAENLVAVTSGRRAEEFRYRPRGELITIGRHRAVGEVFGRDLTGRFPWVLRHANHIATVPTFAAKARLVLDWTVGMAFPRDISELGSATEPHAPIDHAVEALERDQSASER